MSKNVRYTGIAKSRLYKDEPWHLVAAFRRAEEDGNENLAFASPLEGLQGEKSIKKPGSIATFFNLSTEEALKAAGAIEQTEKDIAAGQIDIDAIPAWTDIMDPGALPLYQPQLNI